MHLEFAYQIPLYQIYFGFLCWDVNFNSYSLHNLKPTQYLSVTSLWQAVYNKFIITTKKRIFCSVVNLYL